MSKFLRRISKIVVRIESNILPDLEAFANWRYEGFVGNKKRNLLYKAGSCLLPPLEGCTIESWFFPSSFCGFHIFLLFLRNKSRHGFSEQAFWSTLSDSFVSCGGDDSLSFVTFTFHSKYLKTIYEFIQLDKTFKGGDNVSVYTFGAFW